MGDGRWAMPNLSRRRGLTAREMPLGMVSLSFTTAWAERRMISTDKGGSISIQPITANRAHRLAHAGSTGGEI